MNIKLNGKEHFTYLSENLPQTISNFWSWNHSLLLSDSFRGACAEFIVSNALHMDLTSSTRCDYLAYDILYKDTIRIEVKSSGYLQAWDNNKLSNIRFNIYPAKGWNGAGYDDIKLRNSDIYIFCLFASTNRNTANPLMLEQWDFYVILTCTLNEFVGSQKTISLTSLKKLNPLKANYLNLHGIVNSLLDKEVAYHDKC